MQNKMTMDQLILESEDYEDSGLPHSSNQTHY
jgi:hypothetical protein